MHDVLLANIRQETPARYLDQAAQNSNQEFLPMMVR